MDKRSRMVRRYQVRKMMIALMLKLSSSIIKYKSEIVKAKQAVDKFPVEALSYLSGGEITGNEIIDEKGSEIYIKHGTDKSELNFNPYFLNQQNQ